jgi:predicted SnoaL-like aldol condensation-catalyzing enzyme
MKTTQIKKATDLIESFATGDTSVGKEVLTKGYIQHNLRYGTGKDAFIKQVEHLASAPTGTTVNNIRAFADGTHAFEDGDYVFLHTIYNHSGTGYQVTFDVFRFESERIAEHWDNITPLAPPNPSGHTQTDGPTEAVDLDKTAQNKALVEQFVKDILMGQDPSKLTSYFDGDNYVQHNSGMADGLTGLNAALTAEAKAGFVMAYDKLHMVLGQGNFVLSISEGNYGGAHTSFYDLFRVENSKIAEHWDVIETIPEKSAWANQNGKF